jgi:hypothetical protein
MACVYPRVLVTHTNKKTARTHVRRRLQPPGRARMACVRGPTCTIVPLYYEQFQPHAFETPFEPHTCLCLPIQTNRS